MLMSDIDTVHFRGNNRLLHQACSNLIQNAIKYSNPNSMIDVNLFNNEGTIYFTVTNEGIPFQNQCNLIYSIVL